MSIEYAFILLSIVSVAATFVVLTAFAIRTLIRGKHSMFAVGTFVVPVVLFGILIPLTAGDVVEAAILTSMIMTVLAIIGLIFSGLRGLTG